MSRNALDRLPGGSLVVLSPHLDDAVFSLGAGLARAARAGAEVTVVTVFAGDPDSEAEAGPWDRRAGYTTVGEAARARREEDRRACRLIGARPVWLPFEDGQRGHADGCAVWTAVEPLLAPADSVLVPGFPLVNDDHSWLAALVLEHAGAGIRIGLYLEQPYATWYRHDEARRELMHDPGSLVSTDLDWVRLPTGLRGWLAKQRALRAYRSQLGAMATPLQRVPLRVALYELRNGGEAIAWVKPQRLA